MPFYDSNVMSLLAWEEFNNILKLAEDWGCNKSLLNPYINVKNDLTEAQVRTQLIDDEKSAAALGNAHPHETTLSGFIILALMLEESQYINLIQIILSVYMVRIESWLAEVANKCLEELEDINLWFQSSLSMICGTEMCQNDIADIEAKLQESQCQDMLNKLGNQLHTKMHCIKQRNTNIHGKSALGEIEEENGEVKAGSRCRSKKAKEAARRGLGEGYKMILWIWTIGGVTNGDDDLTLNNDESLSQKMGRRSPLVEGGDAMCLRVLVVEKIVNKKHVAKESLDVSAQEDFLEDEDVDDD
ncbi:hypothetical protein BDR04DRAFT_1122829 [Suillus decipiens]|nr:hypothetical protein BDR04DRAFT_1122829 [Suillus decipiens]